METILRQEASGRWHEQRHEAGGMGWYGAGVKKESSLPRLPVAQSEDDSHDQDGGVGTAVIPRTKPRTRVPSFYKVVLLNDDYTPMDFVVHILQKFFHKNVDEASQIMLQVHQEGAGIAGVFSYEIAETKVFLVNQYSKQHKYPLKCTLEKA